MCWWFGCLSLFELFLWFWFTFIVYLFNSGSEHIHILLLELLDLWLLYVWLSVYNFDCVSWFYWLELWLFYLLLWVGFVCFCGWFNLKVFVCELFAISIWLLLVMVGYLRLGWLGIVLDVIVGGLLWFAGVLDLVFVFALWFICLRDLLLIFGLGFWWNVIC